MGDINLWRELARINNLANPNLIFPGQVLPLPPKPKTTIPITTVPIQSPADRPNPPAPAGGSFFQRNKSQIYMAASMIGLLALAFAINRNSGDYDNETNE